MSTAGVHRGTRASAVQRHGNRGPAVRRPLLLTIAVVLVVLVGFFAVSAGLGSRRTSRGAGAFGAFTAASELTSPLPAAAVLDPANGSLMTAFAKTSTPAVVDTGLFGVPVYTATSTTPRYRVDVLNSGLAKWGFSSVTGQLVPIPTGAKPATGSDGKLVIIDKTANKVFDLWQARLVNGHWQAGWGSIYPYNGDGVSHEVSYGTGANQVTFPKPTSRATGSGFSSLAGLITASEMKAGVIDHALVFSSDVTCGPRDGSAFRFPATATDGITTAAPCLPEGSRIRLNPAIQLSLIPGLTAAQVTIGKALQKYGAYLIDTGGSRLALIAQAPRTAADTATFNRLGMGGDYFSLPQFSLGSFQLMAKWNGK